MHESALAIRWSPGEQRLFDEADSFTPDELMRRAVERLRVLHRESGYDRLCDTPPVPDQGASEEELVGLERVVGIPLPTGYRTFLRNWRYLVIADGFTIWGVPRRGWDRPDIYESVFPDARSFMRCGSYFQYSSLLIDVRVEDAAVWTDLHGRRSPFAPTFSLALWRITEMVLPAGHIDENIKRTRLMVEDRLNPQVQAKRRPWWRFW